MNINTMKKILQYELDGNFIREWDSLKAAADGMGLKTHANISSACSGHINVNTVKNFMWRYYSVGYPLKIEPAVVRGEKFKKEHGVGSSGHNELLDKRKSTNKTKYGADHHMQTEAGILNHKASIVKKYGVDNVAKLDYIIKRISETERTGKTAALLKRFERLNFIEFVDNKKMKFVDPTCGHEFIIHRQTLTVRDNWKNTICTVCNPTDINNRSELEDRLINDILSKSSSEVIEKNVKGLIPGRKFESDLYFPEHKIGVEVNGLIWHNDAYRPKGHCLEKHNLFEAQDINLMQFFEDEINDKLDIVTSVILSKLRRFNNIIYARKCKVVELDDKMTKKFLDENHLQGWCTSKIRYGLIHNEQLVSIMTFSDMRSRIASSGSSDNHWELTRYCNKLNTSVIGSAGRLFTHFIKNINPDTIISYSNKRFSLGKVWEKIGFKKTAETQQGYWYVVNNKREHRWKYRKSELIKMGADPLMSETEIMESLGIPKIYDCGNIRFTWTKKN